MTPSRPQNIEATLLSNDIETVRNLFPDAVALTRMINRATGTLGERFKIIQSTDTAAQFASESFNISVSRTAAPMDLDRFKPALASSYHRLQQTDFATPIADHVAHIGVSVACGTVPLPDIGTFLQDEYTDQETSEQYMKRLEIARRVTMVLAVKVPFEVLYWQQSEQLFTYDKAMPILAQKEPIVLFTLPEPFASGAKKDGKPTIGFKLLFAEQFLDRPVIFEENAHRFSENVTAAHGFVAQAILLKDIDTTMKIYAPRCFDFQNNPASDAWPVGVISMARLDENDLRKPYQPRKSILKRLTAAFQTTCNGPVSAPLLQYFTGTRAEQHHISAAE